MEFINGHREIPVRAANFICINIFLILTFFMQKTTSTILKICKQVTALLPLQIALKEWNEVQGSQCAIITKKNFFFYIFVFLGYESSDFRMTVDATTMKSLLKYIVNKFSYDCRGQWNE